MSFPLAKAQRTQRFLWNDPLSDLGGLARKIPASSYYSLAKAQRTQRFLWNDPLSDLGGLARKIPARREYRSHVVSFTRKGAKNAKIPLE